MKSLLFRIFANAVALWLAATLIDGIQLSPVFGEVVVVALVLSAVNALVKPVIKVLTLPFILLTLGLFSLVVNAGMLMLTDAFTPALAVADFKSAFLGSLVISLVNVFMGVEREDE
jgi:putative membrane protein